MASFFSKSYLSKFHIEIIGEYQDMFFWNLIKIYQEAHTLSREIHKSEWFEENYFLSLMHSFTNNSFELRVFPFFKIPVTSK
jgi:hypothetical protein